MPSDAMMTLGVDVNDTIKIYNSTYDINESRFGEQDIIRLPLEVKKNLHLEDGNVIQNSRLKEIFENSIVTHNQDLKNNSTIKEKFIVTTGKNSSTYEIFLDNESIGSSFGVFKDNEDYSISLNGNYLTSFNYKNNLNKSFNYEGHNVTIVFEDTNSTSIKQFTNNFLDISFKK